MKWFIYLTSIAACLGAGYWLGTENNNAYERPSSNIPLSYTPANTPAETPAMTAVTPASKRASPKTKISIETLKSPAGQTIPDQFLLYLSLNQYHEAVSTLYNTESVSTDYRVLKEFYIRHVLDLLQNPKVNKVNLDNAIKTYLASFYDDTDMLLLQASYYMALLFYSDAINTLQLANSYTYNPEQTNMIIQTYNNMIKTIDILLSQRGEWARLTDIYRHAESAGLLQDADRFRLAEIYLLKDERYFAEEYLSALANNPKWKTKVAALLPTATKTEALQKHVVPLKKIADQFIISAQLSGNDTNLLIDTGASITTLSKKYFESIERRSQFSYQHKQTFLTANGQVSGEVYTVDTFQIGQYLLNNIQIAVIDFPTSRHSSGLLGMNVLRGFEFEIDQKKALLHFKKNTP